MMIKIQAFADFVIEYPIDNQEVDEWEGEKKIVLKGKEVVPKG